MDACSKPGANMDKTDATDEVAAISAAFDKGLSKIMKVGSDKYLGLPDFKDVSEKLGVISDDLAALDVKGECCGTNQLFCSIRDQANNLAGMGTTVNDAIDDLIDNDMTKLLKENASYLQAVHALPYILVLSMVLFTLLWWKNGACCCCTNGTCFQTGCIIVPQVILWFVAFGIMAAFTVVGWAVTIILLPMKTPEDLFEGRPTFKELLNHIQETFTEFWDIVLADLIASMDTFRTATTIFTFACIFIIIYACCFCCCRPYATGEKSGEEAAKQNQAEPEAEGKEAEAETKDSVDI
jgi:hypothetical protein